jgi:alcohol dehydrogenase class IV
MMMGALEGAICFQKGLGAVHSMSHALGVLNHQFLNIPVVVEGRTLGTLNLLHKAAWYEEKHVAIATPFAYLLAPLFTAVRGEASA